MRNEPNKKKKKDFDMAKKTIDKSKFDDIDDTNLFLCFGWHAKDSFGFSQDNFKILWTWQTQGWS